MSANSDDLNFVSIDGHSGDCHHVAYLLRKRGYERAADKIAEAGDHLESAEAIRRQLEGVIEAIIRYDRGDWGTAEVIEEVERWEASRIVVASRGRGRPLMGQRRKRRR